MSIVLESQVVLVTGANRGIGKTILETALARGAKKVYAAVRNTDSVKDLVAEGIFDALRDGPFHVFPDSMAKRFESAYEDYAKSVVEAAVTEEV